MLVGLLIAACLALGVLVVAMSVMGKEEGQQAPKASAHDAVAAPEIAESSRVEGRALAAGMIARSKAEAKVEAAAAREAAREAAAREAAAREAAEEAAAKKAAAKNAATAAASPTPAIPADTTMYLTVPKLGLQDIPVVEGTTEASLDEGAGHYTGSGYPWYPGSNTYIAGHRIGYPGTLSDHVFYYLPNLVQGDEIIITDTLGQTYTYQVSDILEVPITDLSVTTAVPGRDIVSLQTCIENYGDYWTEGPNWYVRYVVQADRVS